MFALFLKKCTELSTWTIKSENISNPTKRELATETPINELDIEMYSLVSFYEMEEIL
jgi:hypothetical protein